MKTPSILFKTDISPKTIVLRQARVQVDAPFHEDWSIRAHIQREIGALKPYPIEKDLRGPQKSHPGQNSQDLYWN